jgi:zinc transport system permease protein
MVLEILQYAFFQKALMIAILASVAAGVVGTYIVIKRISLITGSIAHTAFGGLGLSFFMGVNPLLGATAFSLLAAGIISFFRKRAQYRLDTLLSFLWSTGMAIGLVFLFMTPGYATDLFTFLFGNILLVSSFDLILIAVLNVAVLLIVAALYNNLLAVSFDEEYAQTRNLPVSVLYFILFALISLTIVAVIRVVGIVLMIAILTIPPATSRMFSKTVKNTMLLSVAIALVSMVGGLFLSAILDFPTGPVIVLLTSVIYLIAIVLKQSKLA